MSVLKSKRKESRYEAVIFSSEIHDMLIDLMARNFGIKDVDNIARSRYAHGKDKQENFAKYRYLLCDFKTRTDNLAAVLTNNLRAAYALYPTSLHELEIRRDYQNRAIANCEQLVKELQKIVDVFEVDINLYERYIEAIDREIGLIKKWRQSDNKLKHSLDKKGSI